MDGVSAGASAADACHASVSAPGWWDRLMGAGFMPHGHCYLWRPEIVWAHVVSDILIAVAYYSIPMILFWFASRRRDVPFNGMFILFGIFILACGTTHVIEVITVWRPIYVIGAVVKIITAAVSVVAAVMLVPVMPKALALPSLRTANRQLEQALAELRRANAELEQFAYISSHDLQEPVRMVGMYTELLERRLADRLTPEERQHMGFVREGATRMRVLIDDLLGFARLEREAPQPGEIAAEDALQAALDHLQPALAASGARLDRTPLPRLHADLGQLTQLFQNLIGNALKYRSSDQPWVRVGAKRGEREWIISVEDNGIGIDPAYHRKIFEVFQRLHHRDQYPGTGIGLAICRKIVERHGGRLWVDSQPGVGASFHFSIPDPPSPAAGEGG